MSYAGSCAIMRKNAATEKSAAATQAEIPRGAVAAALRSARRRRGLLLSRPAARLVPHPFQRLQAGDIWGGHVHRRCPLDLRRKRIVPVRQREARLCALFKRTRRCKTYRPATSCRFERWIPLRVRGNARQEWIDRAVS